MATEKQIEANRQNAQKSTGPATDEGKQRSRGNALKHGLAGAGVVMEREDDEGFAEKLELYREHIGPADVLEEDLVRNMALASVRVERCRRQEFAELAGRKKRVMGEWRAGKKKEVNELIARFKEEPALVVGKLERMTLGCEWLLDAWADVEGVLEKTGTWERGDLRFALALLGRMPRGNHEGDAVAEEWIAQHRATQPDSASAGKAQARGAIRALIKKEKERIARLRQEAWQGYEGLELAEQLDAVEVDTTQRGTLLLRYGSAADNALHRNLARLTKLRLAEPEHLSVKRWIKQGKQCARIWNGVAWVPAPDAQGVSGTPGWGIPAEEAPGDGTEAALRNEANPEAEDPVVEQLKAIRAAEEAVRKAAQEGGSGGGRDSDGSLGVVVTTIPGPPPPSAAG